jgi:hypothetical protein
MLAPLATLAAASLALAQGSSSTIQLQLRIVPQIGLPADAGGVIDLPGTVHQPIDSDGQTRRFEIQYRLVDLDDTDDIVPAGLVSGNLRIIAFGSAGSSVLERALLSRFEAQLASSTPPVSPDLSGNNSNAARGMHRPFRGPIPLSGGCGPAPGNNCPSNGVFSADRLTISGITPLSLSAPNQYTPGGDDGLGEWYGLYSFNFLSAGGAGAITFTASFDADQTTGSRFGFFNGADPVPWTGANALPAAASLQIRTPGGCCIADTCLITTPDDCAAMSGHLTGANTCAPGPCCPAVSFASLPTNVNASLGQSLELTATVNSAAPLSFRWQRNGIDLFDDSRITGAATPTLRISSTTFDDLGSYILAVTSCGGPAGGGRTIQTPAAQLRLCGVNPIEAPLDVTVRESQTNVVLRTPAAITESQTQLRWFKNGLPIPPGTCAALTMTGATYTIARVSEGDAGIYHALITTPTGCEYTSPPIVLTVVPCGPAILQHPARPTVRIGDTASFTVVAEAGTHTYRWRRNGIDLAIDSTGRVSGFATPTLTITGLRDSDAGAIDVVVSNACSATVSRAAILSPTACTADTDRSGGVTLDDLFLFLQGYFAGCP